LIFGVDEGEVLDNASFIDDLDGDSLDIYELLFAVEDEFDLNFEEVELSEISTIRDFKSFVGAN
ncbi:MAG TPA: phosphopantetheine-binding protein, partial [Pyrinomonadaceae bacterium]|nr:phosphopantetheine-binding protein [Pyrinomonadaceae bacterium]